MFITCIQFIIKKRFNYEKTLERKNRNRVIYPFPVHKMKGYATFFKNEKYVISEIKSKGIFSLPLYPELRIQDINIICKKLKKILFSI